MRSRFTEEQVMRSARGGGSGGGGAVPQARGVSSPTFYKLEARKLKALEEETGRLKRMLADAMLDTWR